MYVYSTQYIQSNHPILEKERWLRGGVFFLCWPSVPSFYWEKDGERLSDGDKYTITENGPKKFVQIQDLVNDDSGKGSTKQQMNRGDFKDLPFWEFKTVGDIEPPGVYRCVAELEYYPVAVAFNVSVERGDKDQYYGEWSAFRWDLETLLVTRAL